MRISVGPPDAFRIRQWPVVAAACRNACKVGAGQMIERSPVRARTTGLIGRRELFATGETGRKRVVENRGELTAQEAQIARLARDGLSNPEIAIRLFISPRTVQYHLRKVFIKLGIGSRNELDRVLPGDPISAPLP
jgi:DNA-binding CsgD family transcriptional regulator